MREKDAARRAGIARNITPITTSTGLTIPAWTNRQHGALTGEELSHALYSARQAAEEATGPQAYAERARVRGLEEEGQLRAHMSRGDIAREEYQRANRYDPLTGGGDPRIAQYQFEAAAEMKRALNAEAYRRRLDAPTVRAEDGLTRWSAPTSGLLDAALSEEWRTALASQRSILRESLIQAGKDATTQPWMRGVHKPEHLSDEQWNTTVGQIQLWRTTHKISPDLSVREAAAGVRDEEIRALMDSLPAPMEEKQVAAVQKEAGEEDPMQRLQRIMEELGANRRKRAAEGKQIRNHATARTNTLGRNAGGCTMQP